METDHVVWGAGTGREPRWRIEALRRLNPRRHAESTPSLRSALPMARRKRLRLQQRPYTSRRCAAASLIAIRGIAKQRLPILKRRQPQQHRLWLRGEDWLIKPENRGPGWAWKPAFGYPDYGGLFSGSPANPVLSLRNVHVLIGPSKFIVGRDGWVLRKSGRIFIRCLCRPRRE